MKNIRALALATAVSALATGAYASTTLDLTYNGQLDFQKITISSPNPAGGPTGGANAGAFDMTGSNAGDDVPTNVIGSFIAWCLDLSATMFGTGSNNAESYKVTDTPFVTDGEGFEVITSDVENYFNANFSNAIVSNANASAAFQVGLWKTIYGDSFNYSASDTIVGLVNDNLTAAGGPNIQQLWTLTYLQSDTHQSLVTATPIPLPAAAFLMLGTVGFFGGAAALRRRQQKAAA